MALVARDATWYDEIVYFGARPIEDNDDSVHIAGDLRVQRVVPGSNSRRARLQLVKKLRKDQRQSTVTEHVLIRRAKI